MSASNIQKTGRRKSQDDVMANLFSVFAKKRLELQIAATSVSLLQWEHSKSGDKTQFTMFWTLLLLLATDHLVSH